jgi:murein DD-endopeptidase MepM/ murein hydrolase activator NlpD
MTAFINRVMVIALGTTALATTALSSGPLAATLDAPARASDRARLAQSTDDAPAQVGATAAPLPSETLPERAAPPVNRQPGAQPRDIDGAPTPSPVTTAPEPYPTSNQPLLATPRPMTPSAPARAAPTYKISVDGKVESTPNASFSLVVEKGDTVNVIAEHLQTPAKDIIKLNKLKKPYALDVGTKLKIPTEKVYIVQSGDTLYSISRRFTVKPAVLADVNDMDVGARLRAGQKIALPIDHKDTGPVRTLVASRSDAEPPTRASRRPMMEVPSTEGATPPTRYTYARPSTSTVLPPTRYSLPPTMNGTPQVDAAPPPSESQVMAAGRGRFAWPVRGELLSGFGAKPGGQKNDGMDIASSTGQPVMAAAAGEVVYAGNQVPGFGNLVLIKHDGGWVTAYAHLSRTEVKIKDHVGQGDEIGQVGTSGGVDQPQLHFEIRYAPSPRDKARPIDPTLVLTPR